MALIDYHKGTIRRFTCFGFRWVGTGTARWRDVARLAGFTGPGCSSSLTAGCLLPAFVILIRCTRGFHKGLESILVVWMPPRQRWPIFKQVASRPQDAALVLIPHDDKKQGVTVIVMQRINDNDLSAHVMKTAEEHYVHLKIEAEAPERKVIVYPRSGKILIRESGALLWEEREGPVEIQRQKAVMGRWKYSSQYQQDPIPEGGAIFQREWFSHRFHLEEGPGR
jgi:hypothetical protein